MRKVALHGRADCMKLEADDSLRALVCTTVLVESLQAYYMRFCIPQQGRICSAGFPYIRARHVLSAWHADRHMHGMQTAGMCCLHD